MELRYDIKSNGSAWKQLTKSAWLVLVILFLVTGALGLPLLWYSPAFSYRAKWILSIVVTIYTAILIAGTAAVVWWAYLRISSLL